MKRIWFLLAVLALLIFVTGCKRSVTRVQIMFPNQTEEIAIGQELRLIPAIYGGSGTLVFESDDEEIVSVLGDTITGEAEGSATITAYFKDDKTIFDTVEIIVTSLAGTSIRINANSNILINGDTIQLAALVVPSYSSQEVTWSTSNEEVATVDESGKVTGISEGSVVISATSVIDTSLVASYTIQVNNYATATNITITNTETEVYVGAPLQMTCTIEPDNASPRPIWSVGSGADSGTAAITEEGVLTGVTAGTITVVAKDPYDPTVRGTYTIIVKYHAPESMSIEAEEYVKKIGSTAKLKAKVLPTSASQMAIWSTSDESIATVSEAGLVTFVSYGDVTITAVSVDDENIKATYTIEDIPKITGITISYNIEDPYPTENGGTLQLFVTMTFAAGVDEELIDKSVTWASSNTNAATVDENGLVTRINVYFHTNIIVTSVAYPSITATFGIPPLAWD